MSALVWVMIGVALWHFTVFVPDHFQGGIVGALMGAIVGGFISGLLINGLTIPGRTHTHLISAIDAVPGAIIGMALIFVWGLHTERRNKALALQRAQHAHAD